MSTFQTVKAQIQELIDNANAKTEKTDVDLTSAIGSLIEGYGVGGESSKTYADQLYEHFGVDKSVYPYLAVGLWTDRNSCTIIFGKTVTWDYSSLAMRNGYWHDGGAIDALEGVDRSDINTVVSTICQNLTTLKAASEMWGIKNQSDNIWYCNFDPTQFSNVQCNAVGGF